MSASLQAFPNPGAPTTPGIYPTTTTPSIGTGSQDTRDRSNGSFGMVFAVLAIILVISAVACALGRFCGKKANNSHKQSHGKTKNQKHGNDVQDHNHGHGHNRQMNHPSHSMSSHLGPKQGGSGGRPREPDLEFGCRSKEGDIKLGFDPKIKIPSSKVANHGDHNFRGEAHGHRMGMANGLNMDMGPDMGFNMNMGMGRPGRSTKHHGHGEPEDFT